MASAKRPVAKDDISWEGRPAKAGESVEE